MIRLGFCIIVFFGTLGSLVNSSRANGGESAAVVVGKILIEGKVPAAKEWPLDKTMEQFTGEKVYRDETWLVGVNRGLANCVVTLKSKGPTKAVLKPMEKTFLDKVGLRYSPRVLVVTPGTEVVLRNKESPCRGFWIMGKSIKNPSINVLVKEGTEYKFRFVAPDHCTIRCPARPYTRGFIQVVDTPYHAVTNGDGEFTIRGVPAGEYQVAVWHEGVGDFNKSAGPTEISIAGKGEKTLNFRVRTPGGAEK